jgi:hypothetical protein
MADTKEVQRLVGKMMVDPAFRHQMARDPAAGAKAEGVTLTPEQAKSFQQNAHAFVNAGAELDRSIVSGAAGAAGHVIAVFNQ